jgi:hypothetical protein
MLSLATSTRKHRVRKRVRDQGERLRNVQRIPRASVLQTARETHTTQMLGQRAAGSVRAAESGPTIFGGPIPLPFSTPGK